jgi:hypothetical protein
MLAGFFIAIRAKDFCPCGAFFDFPPEAFYAGGIFYCYSVEGVLSLRGAFLIFRRRLLCWRDSFLLFCRRIFIPAGAFF